MDALTLTLVRHGVTDANERGLYLGRTDVPLNTRGNAQAVLLYEKLGNISFDAAYASPLRRCMETARIIRPDNSILPLNGLMELDFGAWEGLTWEQARDSDSSAWKEWTERGIEGAPPGGERAREMHERVVGTIEDIVRRHEERGGNLLIVAHGGTLRSIAAWAVGLHAEGAWRFSCEPGSAQRIVIDKGFSYISSWNICG